MILSFGQIGLLQLLILEDAGNAIFLKKKIIDITYIFE